MLRIISPGLQATLQGAPRTGHRRHGIPASGPADTLSMALANRLVGNPVWASCIEITYGGFDVCIDAPASVAVTGAFEAIHIAERPAPGHQTLHLRASDQITLSPFRQGMRAYLAVHSGLQAQSLFGSASTYLPAAFGGHEGRALEAGDLLAPAGDPVFSQSLVTPEELRPVFRNSYALRACPSAETVLLTEASRRALFGSGFTIGRQATRMGVELTGPRLDVASDGAMKSAPVFPGTIQCPASGVPIALLCDAQTTGGYPRIAHIARCDRHLLGQLRPGDSVRLLERTPDAAAADLMAKQALLVEWLGSDADVLV